jgi:hypothetical protein
MKETQFVPRRDHLFGKSSCFLMTQKVSYTNRSNLFHAVVSSFFHRSNVQNNALNLSVKTRNSDEKLFFLIYCCFMNTSPMRRMVYWKVLS